jgi:hypothetical protein
VANTSDEHPGEINLDLKSIVGLHLTWRANLSLVSDCDVEVGAFTFGQGTPNPDTNLRGSTGVLVEAHNVVIDNLKIHGNPGISNEIGVRIATDRNGGDFLIDARGGGFSQSGDCVVQFDTPGTGQEHCEGQVWYILYSDGDTPVRISPGWGPTLKIFTRSNLESDWTPLTTGKAYP